MSAVLLDVESQFSIESHDRKVTNATISEQLLISLLNEDHTYLYYLILILKLSGLYSFPSSPRRYFTYFIIFIMWLAIVSVLINLLLYPSSEHLYHQIGNAIWMIHAASTYTIVAYDMIFLNGRLLIFMNSIISRQNNQYFTNYCLLPETYCRNLKLVSCLSCIAVICGVIGNIISIGYLYFTADGLYLVLRVTRSLWFDVLGFCLWYFFSYGWVISIPFVCIPIYALNCRIESMIEFIKTAEKEPIAPPRPSNSKVFFSLEKTMSWYDELHTANRLLVFNISMLLTVDIVLCSILSVFLLHVGLISLIFLIYFIVLRLE